MRDARTGGTVDLDRLRRALTDNEYAEHVTFEPGRPARAQPPLAADAADGGARTSGRGRLGPPGRRTRGCRAARRRPRPPARRSRGGCDSPRYDAMERHFDSIGPAGRVMMRRTASTQVCLDWWPGADGVEQWRVLQLCGPLARCGVRAQHRPGLAARDLARRRPGPHRLRRPAAARRPGEAYARFARGARPQFAEPHLTTLFPPVRPRGTYLEVRYLDAQPMATVAEPIEVLARIAHDDEVRRRVLADLEPRAHAAGRRLAGAAAGCPVARRPRRPRRVGAAHAVAA